jgi:mxaD protein
MIPRSRAPLALTRRHWLALMASTAALPAGAHGPTPQKVDEQIDIAAPPDKVWAAVADFANPGWNPTVTAAKADKGNAAGSRRSLTLASGGSVIEELDELDAGQRVMAYRSDRTVDPKVLPTSSYTVKLRVLPQGEGSRVEWRARAYRADTGNEPAPGRDDAAAVRALQAHIRPGLAALKQKLEAR